VTLRPRRRLCRLGDTTQSRSTGARRIRIEDRPNALRHEFGLHLRTRLGRCGMTPRPRGGIWHTEGWDSIWVPRPPHAAGECVSGFRRLPGEAWSEAWTTRAALAASVPRVVRSLSSLATRSDTGARAAPMGGTVDHISAVGLILRHSGVYRESSRRYGFHSTRRNERLRRLRRKL